MPDDAPLWGEHKKFGLENHQGAGATDARERVSHYLLRWQNQGAGTKVPYSRLWMAQWQVNGRSEPREHYAVPSRGFLEQWYPDDQTGLFLEMDDRHEFSDAGTREGSFDGRVLYPPYGSRAAGPDKEYYRYFFSPRGGNPFDRWDEFIEFARVMTPGILDNEEFDERIWEILDVEQLLNVFAVRLNTDDWDYWGARRGKNCYWYRPPEHGKWINLAWDCELTYGDTNSFMPPRLTATSNPNYSLPFAECTRFINRPRIKRMYYGILDRMINFQFDREFLTPYTEALVRAQMNRNSTNQTLSFISTRSRALSTRVAGVTSENVPFALESLNIQGSTMTAVGTAPVDAANIVFAADGEPIDTAVATFSEESLLGWQASGELPQGQYMLGIFALNYFGEVHRGGTDRGRCRRADGAFHPR